MLCKGFEIELYTGTPQGKVVGLADQIVRALPGFAWEPDRRNVEYTTPPRQRYEQLLCDLVQPRQRLRQFLHTLGDYTLIPGSTLALGDSTVFERSDPHNPYHSFIEQTYGSRVVTASVHINIGIAEPETLLRACRLVRLEAPLYLALSASSPWLDGQLTGWHSTRWQQFPHTPPHVPLFLNHRHFIQWTETQLQAGTMQNVRHLWCSVRPNGNRRPYDLNRLELRICDLISDPIHLLAVTALLEARLLQLLHDPRLDPLYNHPWPRVHAEDLRAQADANAQQVARHSLDSLVTHWQDGRLLRARDWIAELMEQVTPTAKAHGFACFLSPLRTILAEGNEAQRWIADIQQGQPLQAVLQNAIQTMHQRERELASQICSSQAA
ncbi:MAG: glutamate--cysteine ligase [Gloeomargarita sp. SKYG116]|nr:glutamate--cysteine ligase [Gloeomargarita sp. SKYG116]MCS7225524.1 glutamate--cysteine ligase [Gloeomargarita sp. SKYB31]MDW8400771.1 glutamate--cysteine ligase [Gloeomargarita sp. SKYGB_i_bin116]